MNNLDICEKAYYYEIDRMDKLNSRITIPIGILTVFGGFVINGLAKFFSFPDTQWVGVYKALALVSMCVLAVAVYLAIRAYHGYNYGHITSFAEIDEYYRQLIEHKKAQGKNEADANSEADNDINKYYIEKLKECRDLNFDLNSKKLKYQLLLGLCIVSLIPLQSTMYVILVYYKSV